MSKQDRQGVRTPAALERKYPFGDIKRNKSNANNQNLLLNQLRNDLATYKKSVNGDIEKINQFMDEANAKFDDLEENDKMWFYSGIPTLENYPAVEWTTDELKTKHMGDMYCDVDNGNMYIFKKIAEAYLWDSCLVGGCDVDHDALYNDGYNKGYADGQSSATSRWRKEGTFTIDANTATPTITHNCGFIPTLFIVYPIDEYVAGDLMILGCVMHNISCFANIEVTKNPNTILENLASSVTWGQANTNAGYLTENTATLGYTSGARLWRANFKYGWIAIGGESNVAE